MKNLLLSVFFIFFLSYSSNCQSIAAVFRKFKIESKKDKGGCKVKSDYKKKRNSVFVRLGMKKKNTTKTPYKYVYASKSAAPTKTTGKPALPPSRTTSSLTASTKATPDITKKEDPKAEPPPSTANTAIKPSNKLKDMPPDQRKKAVQNLPPTRELPPIRFITAQDEFSVVNMDSFMEALELINQGKMVLIEGHTDDVGSDDYNLKLSMKRVEKIRQLLLEAGGNDALISVIGYGERKPLVPNTNAENRQVNRRIEFKIFDLQ